MKENYVLVSRSCVFLPVAGLNRLLAALLLLLSWPAASAAQPTRTAVRRFYQAAVATPAYAARKQALAASFATPGTAAAVAPPRPAGDLPACFEPLDKATYTNLFLGDDDSTPLIPLNFNFQLYGATYTGLYINSNGNVSFTEPISTFSASGFPYDIPMVAPFWGDVDMQVPGSGSVWYKIYPDRIVVTWDKVTHFGATDASRTNTFQVVLRRSTSGRESNVSFAYGAMQWTTGTASGGADGFGGTPATVGINRNLTSPYTQVGRFNRPDATAPNASEPGGVYWLTNKCLAYNVATTRNQPPVATGWPVNNTLTVEVGQTASIAPQFSGPESGETVTLAVDTRSLCQTSYTVTGGASPTLILSVTGAACNVGTHQLTVTATDNGQPAESSRFDLTVVVTNPAYVWTGATSSDWNTARNWSTGTVPDARAEVLIPASASRMPLLFGTGAAASLTVAAGATLNIVNGAALNLPGNVTNHGTLTGGGLLSLYGTSEQAVGGSSPITIGNLTVSAAGARLTGPVLLSNVLTLNGDLTTNNQLLALLSTAQNTAMVVNKGVAVVRGNVTVQRYIMPLINPEAGYRHYAAPVRDATVASLTTAGFSPTLNPAYNTAAAPGTVTPFPTVFGYDQSRVTTSGSAGTIDFDKGWFSPEALSAPLVPGQGYTVNIPAAQTVAFTGTLNNGPISRPVLARGAHTQSGWQLMGNPYAAPLDWEVVAAAATGLDDAVYVYQSAGQYTGNYASYVNGVGSARYLASGQGFFVRTASREAAGTLNFTNAARLTTNNNPVFYRPPHEQRPLLQLDLVNDRQQRDAVYAYFQRGATPGFDSRFDAHKLSAGAQPYLSLGSGQEPLSISGLPELTTDDVVLPLLVYGTAGAYTLEAAQLLNFPAEASIYLRDAQTGTVTDLRQQPRYTFTLGAGAAGPRFSVLITRRLLLSTTHALDARQISLYPNPAHESVFCALPAALRREAVAAKLVNALGQTVRHYSLEANRAEAATPLAVDGVAPGVYTLQFSAASGTISQRLLIE